jgi:ribonuclease HII
VSLLVDFDRALGDVVVGADEAGRGCLAGPLVAAAVRFDYRLLDDTALRALSTLDDSKKLSAQQRQQAMPVIEAHASAITIATRSAAWIDRHGIQAANLTALSEALAGVALDEAVTLVDWFKIEGVRAITRGDQTSAAIAAASIVAKTHKDLLLTALARQYPQWGFERHAGYGTKAHLEAINEYGLSPIHRRSFKHKAPVARQTPPIVQSPTQPRTQGESPASTTS